MSDDQRQMKPWQVFSAARKHLGAEVVARIFNREIRSAHNWGQDPTYTQCRCRNPLELLYVLFERMDTVGLGYVVRAALQYLGGALDQNSGQETGAIKATLPTIQQEILADYTKVAALHAGVEAGLSVEEIMYRKQEAIDEIERTVAKYIEDQRRVGC